MIVGFIGDIHGRVFSAIALAATWQVVAGKRFDLLIQVGDMGAFPHVDEVDAATRRYLDADPSEAEFGHLLQAGGKLADKLRRVREELASPIYFIRGNHEDFDYLSQLTVSEALQTAKVDPFDLLRFVPDGKVLQFEEVTVAFLGGVEEHTDARSIDQDAYQSLIELGPSSLDVLLTHQGPHGSSVGYRGDVHGSRQITRIVERLQPSFHVAGHAHQLSGPSSYGRTTYLGIDALVHSAIWNPEENGFKQGCLAVLDTARNSLEVVTDGWLSDFGTRGFDFDSWADSFIAELGS